MQRPVTPRSIPALRRALLRWYERDGRALPWRVRPEDRARGLVPDPYAVWLSEIMLQQTTVPHATPYYRTFLERWPTVAALAAADRDEVMAAWSGLGYYARARNLMACAETVAASGGVFPSNESALLILPGVGAYTAAAIRVLAFDRPANVVDGNVERVVARLHAVETPLPRAKTELKALAGNLADPKRPGDYAQALMDLGATVCTPRDPDCGKCPWEKWCAASAGDAPADYPRRAPKKARPVRRTHAYVVERDGAVWLRRRPDRGLLGGMLEVPSSPWSADPGRCEDHRPFAATWTLTGEVRHVFTHFTLHVSIWRAAAPSRWAPDDGGFHSRGTFADLALPSLMRKVLRAGEETP
jgi:A/G-specific adenine glycosylase